MILPFQQATHDLIAMVHHTRTGSSYANIFSGKYAHRIIKGGAPETDPLRGVRGVGSLDRWETRMSNCWRQD